MPATRSSDLRRRAAGMADLGSRLTGSRLTGSQRQGLLVVLGVLASLVVLLAGWLAVLALQVTDALQSAAPTVRAVQEDLRRGDLELAADRVPQIQEAGERAASATASPVWRAASGLPWLGVQLTAVTDVVRAFSLVATEVLPTLAEVGGTIDPAALAPVDGQFQLGPLVQAAPRLADAADVASDAATMVAGIDTEPLAGPLAARVALAERTLTDASGTLQGLSVAAALLPPMLGSEGPRQYLVLVRNPAELRSGGGIVGAAVVLTVVDGRITVTDQRAPGSIIGFTDPVLPLTPEEAAVHSPLLALSVRNVTLTPDFPRSAELAAAMWQQRTGVAVDGVATIDPPALSYLLRATGPVAVPGGAVLEADSATQDLLLQPYSDLAEPAAVEPYFAEATSLVLAALAAGQGDVRGIVPAVGRAVDEHRVWLWSARPEEQALIAGTGGSGGFLSGAAPEQAGVFLDDLTVLKLGYWLEAGARVRMLSCEPGTAAALLTLDLISRVPGTLDRLPQAMTGATDEVPATGLMRHSVTVYAPVGATLGEIREGTVVLTPVRTVQAGREVAVVTTELPLGQTRQLTAEVVLPPGQQAMGAWRTPTLSGSGVVPAASCR